MSNVRVTVHLRRMDLVNSKQKNTEKCCSICLENFNISEYLFNTNCNHTFHYDCINLWKMYSNTCPLCRKQC